MPGKAGEAEQVKVASPSRTVIYTLDGVPIFLDTSGKGDFAPTVFSLWKVPHLLRRVWVKHPAVTQFIIGGADLMLPGVDVAPEDSVYDKDALVAVCVHGNPAPLAVGYAAMSSAEARQRAAAGAKGKLVAVRGSGVDLALRLLHTI